MSGKNTISKGDIILAVIIVSMLLLLLWFKESGDKWAEYIYSIIPLIMGTFSLLLGYGVIKQKVKPEATEQQIQNLHRSEKILGFTTLAGGCYLMFKFFVNH